MLSVEASRTKECDFDINGKSILKIKAFPYL
jgi:hypothetical protein